MGMNETPSGERIHIGFFGRRNAGKSSLVNAITGQTVSIVSAVKGTTTDPVKKAMEILPLGPVMLIDTPGFDDVGVLGKKRIERTEAVLHQTDIAVVVVDATLGMTDLEKTLIELIHKKNIPYLLVYNKADKVISYQKHGDDKAVYVSAVTREGVEEVKQRLIQLKPKEEDYPIVKDIVTVGQFILLVVPIDTAAPKGRLILPQQQTIRELLDAQCTVLVVQDVMLEATLKKLQYKVDMVITDSQVFSLVAQVTPVDIPMTSFSILMARHKGFLETAIRGVEKIRHLQNGDNVLISEGCTHHRQCDDIGTVKLPRWIAEFTGKKLHIHTSSGNEFPSCLDQYDVIIHCGGCMLNSRELQYRMEKATRQGVFITNYGTAIAYMKGILGRSLSVFPELQKLIK